MTAKIFVDTNVLVYHRDSTEGEKQVRAAEWMGHLWSTKSGRLSFQVLQEYYVTVTAKLEPGIEPSAARQDVRALLTWRPLEIEGRVMEGAWSVQDRYGLSWWDALIVSAAQLSDCRYLLTEDFQEGQELGSVQVLNPFTTAPGADEIET